RVGIHDSFFRLGGNSMVAMRMMAACRKRLSKNLSMELLFQQKTIAKIVKKLESQKDTDNLLIQSSSARVQTQGKRISI
ncbi:phosphopantetheine-binding protein, partial [Aliikangiella sp. G2MR2-5]|uniref:phosphopantetheine-binding protein n=1 Tax=Aliikangiella sp. G2MR2-5 TaxID=2788943 RepID=UPI0018ABC44A